jgi:hypothetical protein
MLGFKMKIINVSLLTALIGSSAMFSAFFAEALASETGLSTAAVQAKDSVEKVLGNGAKILSSEVPIQSYVSIPLPTRRFGPCAFASFPCPEHLAIGQKPEIAPPDRWWLFDERAEHLLCYSITAVTPFAQPMPPPGINDASAKVSVDEKARLLTELEATIDEIAPAFFKGDASSTEQRSDISVRLSNYVGAEILPYYKALAPDFFAWLDAK